jgi:hypothetical protein
MPHQPEDTDTLTSLFRGVTHDQYYAYCCVVERGPCHFRDSGLGTDARHVELKSARLYVRLGGDRILHQPQATDRLSMRPDR